MTRRHSPDATIDRAREIISEWDSAMAMPPPVREQIILAYCIELRTHGVRPRAAKTVGVPIAVVEAWIADAGYETITRVDDAELVGRVRLCDRAEEVLLARIENDTIADRTLLSLLQAIRRDKWLPAPPDTTAATFDLRTCSDETLARIAGQAREILAGHNGHKITTIDIEQDELAARRAALPRGIADLRRYDTLDD